MTETQQLNGLFRRIGDLGFRQLVNLALVVPVVITLGLKLKSSSLVALAFRLSLRPLGKARFKTDRPSMVLIPKVGGVEDFEAATAAGGDLPFHPFRVSRGFFVKVWSHFGKPQIRSELVSLTASTEDSGDALREFWEKVLRRVGREVKIAAFVSANFNYPQLEHFALACQRLEIPYLVLYKESIKTKNQRKLFERAYEEHFQGFRGHAIAVYSNEESESVRAGLGFPPERIEVVGCPRIDELHSARTKAVAAENVIVLFAIDEIAGAFSPLADDGLPSSPRWDSIATTVETWFFAVAEKNPDWTFVIKVKVGREQQVRERMRGNLPSNVTIVWGGIGTRLVLTAKGVIAFNSTTVLEGIAAGVPVFVPNVLKMTDQSVNGWTLELGGAVSEFSSYSQLVSLLETLCFRGDWSRKELTSRQVNVLERYVGNSDGSSSRRALEFLVRNSNQ